MFTWWGLNGSGASNDILAELGDELRARAAKSRICDDDGQVEDGELARPGSPNPELSDSVSLTGSE